MATAAARAVVNAADEIARQNIVQTLPVEVQALLALEEPEELLRLLPRCDAATLDRLTRQQRLTGRLLAVLHGSTSQDLGADILDGWRRQARRQDSRFERALGQLSDLATGVQQPGAELVLLKGPVIVLLGLLRPWERPFGDLDLLLMGSDVEQTASEMRALGYEQRIDGRRLDWARRTHYHDPRWYHPDHPYPVEMHWHLLRPDDPLAFDIEGVSTVPLGLPGGATLHRLDDADLLTHLSLHFWADRATGQLHGIGQLWDISEVTTRLGHAAWQQLWERAEGRGHTAVVAVVLALVQVLLDRHELDRFPVVTTMADSPQVRRFARDRVCAPRPAHVQLLSPFDDVHFGVGRALKQTLPWAFGPRSPLRWWPSVVMLRILSASLRSGHALGQTYGTEPSAHLRFSYLKELLRLLGVAVRTPRQTAAHLRLDRWAQRLARGSRSRNGPTDTST